jgi:hypothetical protein
MLYVRCQDMLYVTFTEVPVVAEHRKAMLQRTGRNPHII